MLELHFFAIGKLLVNKRVQ